MKFDKFTDVCVTGGIRHGGEVGVFLQQQTQEVQTKA